MATKKFGKLPARNSCNGISNSMVSTSVSIRITDGQQWNYDGAYILLFFHFTMQETHFLGLSSIKQFALMF